ncbi:MAG: hypothetical protein KF866_10060 [Phycisphaeraceae bacterium]|nr:hypothetical protein [Phycisphaeraceae bacterium]
MTTQPRTARAGFDPGWLFLIPGVVALAAAALLPIQDSLEEVRWQAHRMNLVAQHAEERLDRHRRYLAALEAGDPTLARSLASSQLNLAPPDRRPLAPGASLPPASVFDDLNPPPPDPPAFAPKRSRLHRLATDQKLRPWFIAGGMLAIVVGLLPPTDARRPEAQDNVADNEK